jgi:polysaccharide pyruvyl transferase WcaK-like protein
MLSEAKGKIDMKIRTALNKVKRHGVKESVQYCMNKAHPSSEDENNPDDKKKLKILLLTNRDSDNLGDQVIEACDIGLLSTVMKNLKIKSTKYVINSREASIVSGRYLKSKNPKFLKNAETLIQHSDLIVFGGAPMFNYLYQTFYERTAVTLEIAQKYNKPVIFSAIGVEAYDEDNAKCQRLKKALNMDCVKQITTRDDFELLQKYKENEGMRIDKVADPAVFSSSIFRNQIEEKKDKKIGIFILRANGFVDNKIDFSRDESAAFWKSLILELKSKGYDCELLSSGHFADEAFIDYLIRKYHINAGRCVFNMNTPEKLIQKISSYDAVISCRLHPSIIAFSLDVPSLGIAWNTKVRGFYDSVGYGDRVVEAEGIDAKKVVEKIEKIIEEGIHKDEEYLASIYHSLFYAIKDLFCPKDYDAVPYSYSQLVKKIPVYPGTTAEEKEAKLRRKFRRAYSVYNDRFDKNVMYKERIDALTAENQQKDK